MDKDSELGVIQGDRSMHLGLSFYWPLLRAPVEFQWGLFYGSILVEAVLWVSKDSRLGVQCSGPWYGWQTVWSGIP